MTLEECNMILQNHTRNLIRHVRQSPIANAMATTGSRKAQRRCNDLVLGRNNPNVVLVWTIDQDTLPPLSWIHHAVLAVIICSTLGFLFYRFFYQWLNFLKQPSAKKFNYTPLTTMKPSRISMVKIVSSEDQGVLVTKPTRKLLEFARLKAERAERLRAHSSEPIRLAEPPVDTLSLAKAFLQQAGTGETQIKAGPTGRLTLHIDGHSPAHAKTIAYSLSKFATAPSIDSPVQQSSDSRSPSTYAPSTYVGGGPEMALSPCCSSTGNWFEAPPNQPQQNVTLMVTAASPPYAAADRRYNFQAHGRDNSSAQKQGGWQNTSS